MTDSRELVPLATAERATATIWNAIRMRPRTALVAAALTIVTAGLLINWNALVAAGIAPLLPTAERSQLNSLAARSGGLELSTDFGRAPDGEAADTDQLQQQQARRLTHA